MVDLLITNGTVIDGSGNPGFRAAVAIDGDTVSLQRGDVSDVPADRTIDAAGRIVCPGFIDLHSHAPLTILGAPDHEPKVRQGVTTELVGIDGISHAPFRSPEELQRYIWLDSGLNGYPPEPADWTTVAGLLDRYDRQVAINVAYILGNSPVRIWTVGWGDRPATAAEQADMEALVTEAMGAGAWGLSTGLDYPPGSFATTEELAGLAKVTARSGGFYHTHIRNSLRRQGHLKPFEEALEIGRRGDCPVHLTHYYQPRDAPVGHSAYLGLVEEARVAGMDVTFDMFTYAYSCTTAIVALPAWTMDGGPERLVQALQDADERRLIRDALTAPDRYWHWDVGWYTNLQASKNAPYDGRTIQEIAALRGQEPVDAFLDLLLEENLGVCWVGTTPSDATLDAFIAHPYGMIASDSVMIGRRPNPRTYGCFPRVLGYFVRRERSLSLEAAIRKMTSFPAQRLGLPDRGLLRDGYKADVVIFDPETVDAPATGENPVQFPVGIDTVIVNGEVVIDQGRHTGAHPGRALRRGHAS